MSEPKTRAKKIETVAPGILRWTIHDERINTHADACAVVEGGRAVLIDPLPLEEEALGALGKVEAICLTSGGHQRAAWSFRKRFQAKVYAPEGAEGLDEKPDASYRVGDSLPGGLTAIPGTGDAGHALHGEQAGGVVFCGDVVLAEGGKLSFLPDAYLKDRSKPRASARKLLELKFQILCSGHGAPITRDPKAAIRKLLEEDASS